MNKDLKPIYEAAGKNSGIIRTEEIEKIGIGRYHIKDLVENGLLVRETHGLYSIPDEKPDEYCIIQARSNRLIFSYGTALFFHGLSDRVPGTIDVSLPQGYNASRIKKSYPMLRVHYVQSDILEYETSEAITPQGYNIIIYSPERCICELIKKPDSVDKQIYTQAIKQYFGGKYSPRKLISVARHFDVEEQVRKYMEVL